MTAPKIALSELERLANAALPGPWFSHKGVVYDDDDLSSLNIMFALDCRLAVTTAEHIAAANPQTVMRLVAAVNVLREVRDGTGDLPCQWPHGLPWGLQDRIVAALEGFEP